MQITIFLFLRNPELPKDLSISNIVTVNWCSTSNPWRPNVGLTLSHERCRWSRCSRPQGRCRTCCNDSGATHVAPLRTHTRMMIMMTSRISDLAKISKVDGLDRIRKLQKMTACSGGVISLLRSPSGGHMRERGGGGEGAAHQGERRAPRLVEIVCSISP
jgi:hypothetical protein